MSPELTWLLVGCSVLLASLLGGVIGFGTAATLLPILSLVLGAKTAVPVLGVIMIFSNVSRAIFSWKHIDWKAALAFSSAAVPLSMVGAFGFNQSTGKEISVFVAVAILCLVPLRRLANHLNFKVGLKHLPWVGGSVGVVTGLGGAVGPASAPFYLSYGLVKASYVGTDGFNSSLIYISKSIVYGTGGTLTQERLLIGAGLGTLTIIGSFLGRKVIDRFDASSFTHFVEAFILILGTYMLIRAVMS